MVERETFARKWLKSIGTGSKGIMTGPKWLCTQVSYFSTPFHWSKAEDEKKKKTPSLFTLVITVLELPPGAFPAAAVAGARFRLTFPCSGWAVIFVFILKAWVGSVQLAPGHSFLLHWMVYRRRKNKFQDLAVLPQKWKTEWLAFAGCTKIIWD